MKTEEGLQEGRQEGRQEGELPALVDYRERNMLAETLRERDEMKVEEGRREGRREGWREGWRESWREGWREGWQEGSQEGLRDQRALLCSLAGQRFGESAGADLSGILASVNDGAELARVGTLIIGCDMASDFLARARQR